MLARHLDWKTLFGELTCQKKSCHRLCPLQSLFLLLYHRRHCLGLGQHRHLCRRSRYGRQRCRIKYRKGLLSLLEFRQLNIQRPRIRCFRCRRLLRRRPLLLFWRQRLTRDLRKPILRLRLPKLRIARQVVSRQTYQSRLSQIVLHGLPAESSFWPWSGLGRTLWQAKTRTMARLPSLR